MTKEEVIRLVRERLKNYHPGGVTIAVLDQHIRSEEDFWYIPVLPDVQPSSTFEYYDALADVETELSLENHLKVLLVPTMPEEALEVAA